MPTLNGSLTTCAPRAAATSAVRSVEPSETTTRSRPGSSARSSSRTRPMFRSSLYAGRIAMRLSAASGLPLVARTGASSVDMCHHRDADEIEQPSRTVPVRVLVEHALARTASELLRLRAVGEQVAVRGNGLVRVGDHEQLLARLEPAVDPVVRVGD